MGLLDRFIARTVEKYILAMIRSGNRDEDFPNLVYDAARSYTKTNGGACYSDTPHICSLNKEFGGKDYYITFMKGHRATNITLTNQPSAYDIVEGYDDRLVRGVDASLVLDAVLESRNGWPNVVRSSQIDEQSIQSFFELYATIIPNKMVADEADTVNFGLVGVPEVGVLVVMAAILNGEAIILSPGRIEFELSPENRETLLAWQDESFEEFRSVIAAEAQSDPKRM